MGSNRQKCWRSRTVCVADIRELTQLYTVLQFKEKLVNNVAKNRYLLTPSNKSKLVN